MNPEILDTIKVLLTSVMIVSTETIGILQWLKNFLSDKGSKRKRNAFLALCILVPCALFNSTLVPILATAIFNIVFLSLAVEQLAYQAIVNGIPKIVDSAIDKAASFAAKKEENKEGLL